MTKNDEKMVADRAYEMTELPDVLSFCGRYGTAPALWRDGDYESPKATLEKLLSAAAEANLRELLTPVLVVWAQHWHAVGMPAADLAELLEYASSLNQTHDSHRLLTRQLLNADVPEYEKRKPVRCVVETAQMPKVLGIHKDPGAMGLPALLLDTTDWPFSFPYGADALLIRQPSGSAMLIFQRDGRVDQRHLLPEALIVPAELVDQVNALLTARERGFDLGSAEPMVADD